MLQILYGGSFDPVHLGHLAVARGTASALVVAMVLGSVWRFTGNETAEVMAAAPDAPAESTPAAREANQPRLVRADTYLALAALEDHIATIDDALSDARLIAPRGAEVARLCRGESSGAAVASIAPKIKESHRIALCLELLVPLVRAPALPLAVAPALNVLRDAERHLGRWLVLAEIAVKAGDVSSRAQARERARSGPDSARSAWSLVAWALEPQAGSPSVRPTIELVARLSDRPSADKDTTFLFRFAGARAPSARPMLESLAKSGLLGDECAVRAMLHLCRDYGEDRYRDQLGSIARAPRKDALRGLAAAALYDVGDKEPALAALRDLQQSRNLAAMAWSGLVAGRDAGLYAGAVVTEPCSTRTGSYTSTFSGSATRTSCARSVRSHRTSAATSRCGARVSRARGWDSCRPGRAVRCTPKPPRTRT